MIVESSSRPPKIMSPCPHFGDASPRLKNQGLNRQSGECGCVKEKSIHTVRDVCHRLHVISLITSCTDIIVVMLFTVVVVVLITLIALGLLIITARWQVSPSGRAITQQTRTRLLSLIRISTTPAHNPRH